jgi:hypothetical membrane protein
MHILDHLQRHPSLGPWLWFSSLQYFVVQVIVADAWPLSYLLHANTISDLGNTHCGQYGGRFVCSPLHSVMNASFIILGTTMVAGALLLAQRLRGSFSSRLGLVGMALAGIGTIMVGLFPENTIAALHASGAALPFVIGNCAVILFGFSLQLPRSFRLYTIFLGVLGLIACSLFVGQHYLGIGPGGMERLTAYPQTIWLILFGGYSLCTLQWPTASTGSKK